MSERSAALVLRSVDFQESSRIVTLFTREWGKTAVIAKGCRNPKSKFAGQLEPGNLLDVMVRIKPGRAVQTLTDSSYRQTTWAVRSEFARLALVMAYLELCDLVLEEGQPMPDWFDFSESMLTWLTSALDDFHPAYVFPYLQVRVCDYLGYGLEGGSDEPTFLNVEEGSIARRPGAGLSFHLTPAQGHYLRMSLTRRSSSLFRSGMPAADLRQLIHHLDVYIQHHTHPSRERRSDTLLLDTLP